MMTVFAALLRGALRDRVTLFWALVFPLALTVGLGQAFPDPAYHANLVGGVVFLSAVFFGTSGTAFVVLAQRNRGIYKLLRATPFPTPLFVLVLAASRAVVSLGCTVVVAAFAALWLDVPVSLEATGWLLLVLVFLQLSFTLVGFSFGNLASNEGQTAALNNLVNLPVMFATSTFYALERAPSWLRELADVLPFEHALQATRVALDGDGAAVLGALPTLLAFVLGAAAVALVTFRWDPHAPVALRLHHGL